VAVISSTSFPSPRLRTENGDLSMDMGMGQGLGARASAGCRVHDPGSSERDLIALRRCIAPKHIASVIVVVVALGTRYTPPHFPACLHAVRTSMPAMPPVLESVSRVDESSLPPLPQPHRYASKV